MTNSGGFSTYSEEFLEEERKFQALEKRLISEATILEGAVYHHFNADGSFAGISQGEPLESTLAERIAARNALRINPKGDSEESETTQFIKDKSPIPSFLDPERKKVYTQLIKDNPEGYEDNINLLKTNFPNNSGILAMAVCANSCSSCKPGFTLLVNPLSIAYLPFPFLGTSVVLGKAWVIKSDVPIYTPKTISP